MAKEERPTLRDVARELGLSVTQTSRALNGHDDVSASTRDRAIDAAERLGYTPNLEARRLKMPDTRTQSIGVALVSSQRFSDPFFGTLLTAMVDEASLCGYELQLSAPIDAADPTEPYRRAIQAKRVDGFVVLRTEHEDRRVRFLCEAGFPFVTFGRVEGQGHPMVVEAADCLDPAVEHLVDLGHRRIGCLIEPPQYSIGADRHLSFLRAASAAGLVTQGDHVVVGGFHEDTAFDAATSMLKRSDRPSAIVASNDLLALGALRAAATCGIPVPEQLSIVGFDDIDAAAFTTPPLTTLRHPQGSIGSTLVNELVRVIERGPDETSQPIELRSELVQRGSTAPPP